VFISWRAAAGSRTSSSFGHLPEELRGRDMSVSPSHSSVARGTSPQSLFGYEVIASIGEGAGSLIYAVRDPMTSQVCALKHVLRHADKDIRYVQQVEAEYQVSKQFSHPGLRKSYDLKIKKTLLRKAFIDAIAADPNRLPLDFFLRMMHQPALPLAIRLHAAEEALPFVHAKPRPPKKPQAPLPQDGSSEPRVKLRRKADAEPSDLDELDLGLELQDGRIGADDTDGASLQPSLTEPSESAGQPDEPVSQPGTAEPSVQDGSGAPALQAALAGAEATKPTGGEAQGERVPDRDAKQWVQTHPKGQIAAGVSKNKITDGYYIHTVKLLKAWRDRLPTESCRLKSYILETLTQKSTPTGPRPA